MSDPRAISRIAWLIRWQIELVFGLRSDQRLQN
jgi:hypothetical protein